MKINVLTSRMFLNLLSKKALVADEFRQTAAADRDFA